MEPLYETSSSFGGSSCEFAKPNILTVSIPEAKKRRQPTKHYVYKIVVNWSNGQSTVIYRRYSMFFDFMVKLQEMYASLKERNPKFSGESQFPLPDLPGKVLFGRSQTHQVAEKRRVKVEEFCQTLVSLPPEISQSQLVIGFFNTWPDDTLHRSKSPLKDSPMSPNSTSAISLSNGPLSPSSGGSEMIISHPDEMENLELYRVIADYERKDSHQVDLKAGDVVHVIEKHDTGWWMILREDEQGYAPAAHLEAVDKTYDTLETVECSSNEEYEAMESYMAQSEDEIGLSVGDRVTVIHKNMDGWWKIRKKGRTGYCPATIIRRAIDFSGQSRSPTTSAESVTFESEKKIYEVLNIHKPPPRRNTINRQDIYVTPKSTPFNNTKVGSGFIDTAAAYYQVPRQTHSSSSGSDEDRPRVNGIHRNLSPDHYELGPSDNEDAPIYENTDFDHPMDPSEGIHHRNVYQNMSFDETKHQNQTGQPKRLPLKKFWSPQNPRKPQNKPPSKDPDNEYINPKEFNLVTDPAMKGKYVSLMLPNSQSTTTNLSQERTDAIIKAKLTCSKSLGFSKSVDKLQTEDEYVEMDPIYAPVAPDEPDYEESAVAFVQPQDTKKPCPQVPAPYIEHKKSQYSNHKKTPDSDRKKSPDTERKKFPEKRSPDSERKKSPDTDLNNITKGSVLQRTKSLEDLLSKSSPNPSMPGKTDGPPAIQLGRNVPISNGYDHIKPLPNPKPTSSPNASPQLAKKPEAAKKQKKPYSIFKISSNSDVKQEPVISSPVVVQSTNPSVDIVSPLSSQNLPPRTYIAIEDYESQAPGCLSFKQGERCVLVKQAGGGWWLVNIGGQEGWTPGEFWEEDQKSMSRPPAVAPPKLPPAKPRSYTSGNPTSVPNSHHFQHSHSIDCDEQGIVNKPLPARPRGPPPPRPKPTMINNSPPHLRKFEHSGSAGEIKLVSPPPPPPPRKTNSQSALKGIPNEYGLLTEAVIIPLEDCPWFVGGMERERAEQYLIDNGRQREFLVRERKTKKGYYALSIRHHYSVKHFNIDPKSDGSYSMGIMQFSSIEEIVKYYQNNSLFVHEGQPVTLGQPVKPKTTTKYSQH